MTFLRQLPRALDGEHRAQLALLDRLERALAGGAAAELQPLARQLERELAQEVERHFAFEESEIFPRLANAGDGAIAELLADEHATIREVARELQPLLHAAAALALPDAQRDAFRRLALELVERMVAHIQKETMGLLPLLDDLLDEATDRHLALAHAGA